MIAPRPAVQRLKKYRPPLEGRGGKMRLDFNENTVGCAVQVIRALRQALDAEMLTRYPEYQETRVRLAQHFGLKPEEILLTNGTDDAIKTVCDTFVDPDDVMLVPAPTFPVYEFFHNVAGGKVERVRYDENFRLPAERIISSIHPATRWMPIANPNNPTGTLIRRAEIKAILEAAPHMVLLVDEAYQDYSGESVLPLIRKYPNLVVSRTFSKAYGLAGLRMGFLAACPDLIEVMNRAQNPFTVNSLAMLGALEAIKHEDVVRRYVEEVKANRAELSRWLRAQEIPFVPSRSNFILCKIGEHAPEIAAVLRTKKILVRDWSYDPHLQGYLRFTIGNKLQMRRLVEELERLGHLIIRAKNKHAFGDFVSYNQAGWFQ
jgi:histidinol-phosphate aminotransferase